MNNGSPLSKYILFIFSKYKLISLLDILNILNIIPKHFFLTYLLHFSCVLLVVGIVINIFKIIDFRHTYISKHKNIIKNNLNTTT